MLSVTITLLVRIATKGRTSDVRKRERKRAEAKLMEDAQINEKKGTGYENKKMTSH